MRLFARATLSWWLLLMWLVADVAIAAISDDIRQELIARFVRDRQQLGPLCLYSFDRYRPSIDASMLPSSSSSESNDAEEDAEESLLVTVPPMFEELIGRECPFGDLQFDPELVTSLDNGRTTRQLGIHLAEAPDRNNKRPQIASNEVLPAKTYVAWPTDGFSFEFTYRRRVALNQTMTLFTIGSLYGDCGEPGFRVDLTKNHVLMVIYFFPIVRADHTIVCNERRFFSVGTNECVMPQYRENVDDNPVVHVIVTMSVRSSESNFFLKYIDPVTLETHECVSYDQYHQPKEPVEEKYVQGTYRLYLGNNPNNVSSPLVRAKLAAARAYRDPVLESLTPEKRLRFLIKQKLNSLNGPRLPESFRGLGGKSVSLQLFGIQLPPINEDTPFRIMRESIDGFKKDHLDKIIDFIIQNLKQGEQDIQYANASGHSLSVFGSGHSLIKGDDLPTSRQSIFPDANGSNCDLFHFAIHNFTAKEEVVREKIWKGMMTPLRPFIIVKQTVRAIEDQELLIDLLHLHSVFNDLQLEIIELPTLGKLLLYPSKTALTEDNLHLFGELSVEDQQKIYFLSNLHQSNVNIPKNKSISTFGRKFEPYAVFRYRVRNTTTGRLFNASHVATIEVYVDPMDSPPTALSDIVQVDVHKNGPTYLELKGVDEDGVENRATSVHRSLGMFDDAFNFHFGREETKSRVPRQNLKIVKYPRYGRLYDRKMANTTGRMQTANNDDPTELEPFRIHRDWIDNRTFSTSLVYVFNRAVLNSTIGATDELQYRLRVEDAESFSDIATIQFHLPVATAEDTEANETKSVAVVQLDEDSSVTIELSVLEPMTSQLDSKISFRIAQLPRYGKLYQYAEPTNKSEGANVSALGAILQDTGATVNDEQGRVVYVPDPNYFNSATGDDDDQYDALELDSFYFDVVDIQAHLLNASDQVDDMQESLQRPRLIEIQVINVPDKLVILPPTVFATNATRGKRVKVPVKFDDPDAFSGSYRVKLDAKDDVSVFELGHTVTDDDVLRFCPSRTRPCRMVRSANASFVSNERGDEEEAVEKQLHFVIDSQTWDGSEITVEGSKTALQTALSELVFRDLTRLTWLINPNHTAKFDVTIERVNSSFDAKAEMKYYIDYIPVYDEDRNMSSLERVLTDIADVTSLIYTGISIAFVCFVLSSASCCSISFCCCCGRARERKRNEFNDDRRRYEEQVVQNDLEYSTLLMAVTDVILEPELQVSVLLLQSCCDGLVENMQRHPRQVLCVRSLLPLLETEHLGVQYVVRLLNIELRGHDAGKAPKVFAFPSVASLAMLEFGRLKGKNWLREMSRSLCTCDFSDPDQVASSLLDTLESDVDHLPAEIVALCRTCATALSLKGGRGLIDGVHTVFFNHFVGPKLWFLKRDAITRERLSSSQRRTLRKALSLLVSSERDSRTKGDKSSTISGLTLRYNQLLQRILASPALPDHFTSSSDGTEDCELMAMCLMNIHGVLDSTFPALHAKQKIHEKECEVIEPSDEIEELNYSPLDRVRRVLRALNFPLANADTLVSSCEYAMTSDPVLWSGLSSHEWEVRFASVKARPTASRSVFTSHLHTRQPPRDLRHAESLLSVDIHTACDEDQPSSGVFESTRSCDAAADHQDGSTEFAF